MPKKYRFKVTDHMPKKKKKKSLFGTIKPSTKGKITRGISVRSSLPPELGPKRKKK